MGVIHNERVAPVMAGNDPLKSDRLGGALRRQEATHGDRARQRIIERRLAQDALGSAPLDLLGRGYRCPDVLKLDQEARYPDGKALMWFKGQGVVIDSMATPYPVVVAKVAFTNANTFSFDVDGVDAYIFQAEDRGEVIDLVAWRPPATLATLRGVAFCVGNADDILNPATYYDGGALRVHPTALEWLKAKREGIVIVQPRYAFAYLSQARCIECADIEHAAQLDRWLRPPKRTTKIIYRKEAA